MRTPLLTLASAAVMLLACQAPESQEAETAPPVDVEQVEGEVWRVDFTNIALIPLNQDLRRIDAALAGDAGLGDR